MNHELDPETEAAETAETEKRQKTIAMIDQTLARIDRISAEITAVGIHLGLPQSSGDPLEQRLQPAILFDDAPFLRRGNDMKRPYRDVLVWLTDARLPFDQLSVSHANAQAAVAAMLAMYDRDNRLAVRWEQRFARPRTNVVPFGLSRKHRELLRTDFGE